MEEQIFFIAVGFAIGYLTCFYLTLYMGVRGMQQKLHALQAESKKPSPNKVFVERYGDRRKPDQSLGEQVVQAYYKGPKLYYDPTKIKVWGSSETYSSVGKED